MEKKETAAASTSKADSSAGFGTLYLVATPIGNLEDMTYRAVRILREVQAIAAEDTRHTRGLLAHFDIHTPLFSYHEHNKDTAAQPLIERLLAGENIACVSDAGLPGIADPGADLAKQAIAQGITVSVIPGANAALTALIASGLDTSCFSFLGFLPRTKKKRREILEKAALREDTLIFYEAPHRLSETLAEIAAFLGKDRRAAICRELTKRYEEYRRATLEELIDTLAVCEMRGEFVICVAGKVKWESENIPPPDISLSAPSQAIREKDIISFLQDFIAKGESEKEAMRRTAKTFSLSRRDVYQIWLKEKAATKKLYS